MGSAAQPGSVSTFLWIGDGGRPTYGVVEHCLQWRWPELRPGVEHHHQLHQWCLYTPKGGEKIKVAFNTPEENPVAWDEDSEIRLSRIPYFLRAMVKKGVEKHARENRIPLITIELMEELRKKRFGNDAPVFNFDVKDKD